MKRTSLRALREMVSATTGKPLPTVKALRESGDGIIASVPVGGDGLLTVYKSGFYIYKTDIGSTVYAVDRCADYAYEDGTLLDLDEEDWPLRLALEGEDRLERNSDAREHGRHYSYSDDAVERNDLRDQRDFVAELTDEEHLSDILSCLPQRQRDLLHMHFFQGLTHQQVAQRLGVSRQAVTKQLGAAIERLRKKRKTFF